MRQEIEEKELPHWAKAAIWLSLLAASWGMLILVVCLAIRAVVFMTYFLYR